MHRGNDELEDNNLVAVALALIPFEKIGGRENSCGLGEYICETKSSVSALPDQIFGNRQIGDQKSPDRSK